MPLFTHLGCLSLPTFPPHLCSCRVTLENGHHLKLHFVPLPASRQGCRLRHSDHLVDTTLLRSLIISVPKKFLRSVPSLLPRPCGNYAHLALSLTPHLYGYNTHPVPSLLPRLHGKETNHLTSFMPRLRDYNTPRLPSVMSCPSGNKTHRLPSLQTRM